MSDDKGRPPLLEVHNLIVTAPWGPVVRGVDLRIGAGEIVGLVGESGSGKTITARALMGLLPRGWTPSGKARLGGHDLMADPAGARGKKIGMVFQEPAAAMNPYLSVEAHIREAMVSAGQEGDVEKLLLEAGIPDPERVRKAFPHQLSGGLKQRALIAAALAGQPALLIADEPTTALDPTVGARTLEHLAGLARARGLAVLLITHDLAAARSVCGRILVMYAGSLAEEGPSERLFLRPRHPYSAALLAATGGGGSPLPGEPLRRGEIPGGCAFHPRCPVAQALCRNEEPALTRQELGAFRCHFPFPE